MNREEAHKDTVKGYATLLEEIMDDNERLKRENKRIRESRQQIFVELHQEKDERLKLELELRMLRSMRELESDFG